MKKLLSIALCFLSSWSWGEASLTFGASSTDNINSGNIAALMNALGGTGTLIMWVRPTAVPPAANVSFVRGTGSFVFNPTTTVFQLTTARATQSMLATATFASVPAYVANQWDCVAATWNLSGANTDQHIYVGSSTNTVVETTAYGLQRVGSGAVTLPTGFNIGNQAAGTLQFVGQIANTRVWNRALSLSEIQDRQFNTRCDTGADGCVYSSNPGFNGLGTVRDLTGNGSDGTVAGSVAVSNLGPNISIGGSPQ